MSVPMNMEEWQRKLKAEKDTARQKKCESAEILHGYRKGDIKDDEMKLKLIRDEERKKALAAQELLHNYKGIVVDTSTSTTTIMSSKDKILSNTTVPVPVNVGGINQTSNHDGVLESIVQGSVSERAAALAAAAATASTTSSSNNTPSITTSTVQQQQQNTTTLLHSVNNTDNNHSNEYTDSRTITVEEAAVQSVSSAVQEISTIDDGRQQHQHQAESLTSTTTTTTTESIATSTTTTTTTTTITPIEESVMVEKLTISEQQEHQQQQQQQQQLDTSTTLNGATATATAATSTTKLNLHLNKRVDLLLAFGLVTIQSLPIHNLDDYMKAIQTIASKITIFNDNDNNENSSSSSNNQQQLDKEMLFRIDATIPPYVKNVKWDETFVSRSGNTNIKRLVVTVSVPIFVHDNSTKVQISHVKEMIANALQNAIETGDLLHHVNNNNNNNNI